MERSNYLGENNKNKSKKYEAQQRFQLLSDEDLELLYDKSHNKNTVRSTNTWVNTYRALARFRNVKENLEEYEPVQLDTILAQFYAEVRKKDGTDYEQDCLRVMQSSLHRYLTEMNYGKSIISDIEFSNCNRVLEGKARSLREQGKRETTECQPGINGRR